MIQAALRVQAGDAYYRREEFFDSEPLVGDGISFGGADDPLVLLIERRLHMTNGEVAADIAIEAKVLSHYGEDPAFALVAHGFKAAEAAES